MDKGSDPQKILFNFGDTQYKRNRIQNNPFIDRLLPVKTEVSFKDSKQSLKVGEKIYQILFSNTKASYCRRDQKTFIPRRKQGNYSQQIEIGNSKGNQFTLELFFNHIEERLTTEPVSLFHISDKIKECCREEGFIFIHYEAFNKIRNWEEFLTLFTQISTSEHEGRFELVATLIIQYAERCGG